MVSYRRQGISKKKSRSKPSYAPCIIKTTFGMILSINRARIVNKVPSESPPAGALLRKSFVASAKSGARRKNFSLDNAHNMVYNIHSYMCAGDENGANRRGLAAETARDGQGISFMRGTAMNENDTALEKEADSHDPQANAAKPDAAQDGQNARPVRQDAAKDAKPARTPRKHATRKELEWDARGILEDLGHGLTVADICERRSWSRKEYYTRMRVAEELAKEEYDPAYNMAIFLKHTARYRVAQRSAEERLHEMEERLRDLARSDSANPFLAPALAHAYARILSLIIDCDDRTLKRAMELGVVPANLSEKAGNEITFADFMKFGAKLEEMEASSKNDASHGKFDPERLTVERVLS